MQSTISNSTLIRFKMEEHNTILSTPEDLEQRLAVWHNLIHLHEGVAKD